MHLTTLFLTLIEKEQNFSSAAWRARPWPAGGSTRQSQTAVQTGGLLQWPSHRRSLHSCCLRPGSAHSISTLITSASNSQS